MDDDEIKKRPPYEIGQDIETYSVDELKETADLLRAEAARLEAAAVEKQATLTAADAFFRK